LARIIRLNRGVMALGAKGHGQLAKQHRGEEKLRVMEAMQHLSRSGPEVLHLELEPKNANPHASSYPGHCYMIDGFLFDKPVPPMSPLSHPHSKNFRPFYETQICKAPYLSRRVC